MEIIGFYSFKGGTGRTTAVANTAASLARARKNVVCIDLDIDGPGLHVVLDLKDTKKLAIQDYLTAPHKVKPRDLLCKIPVRGKSPATKKGNLYLIQARLVTEAEHRVGDAAQMLLDDLLLRLADEREIKLDYCLLDSPSGFSEMSAICISLVKRLLVFFRYGKQHLLGTAAYSEFLDYLIKEKGFAFTYDLVASSISSPGSADGEHVIEDYRRSLENLIGRRLLADLPQSPILSWQDQVLDHATCRPLDRAALDGFDDLAAKIISKTRGVSTETATKS
jgi:septum site-determining protein MinD